VGRLTTGPVNSSSRATRCGYCLRTTSTGTCVGTKPTTDTKALLEAGRNDDIHAVPVKTIEHQAIASLHRLRSTWLATRTARLNTVRGLLREFGLVIPVGAAHVVPRVREWLADSTIVPDLMRPSLASACDEIETITTHMHAIERQLTALARSRADIILLRTVPGVGLLTATALVALVGDIRRFPTGRHFASFLGLTPKEDSSALRRRLGAISKQGDVYLRMLLIHGARGVLLRATGAGQPTAFQTWARATQQRRGHNIAAVAVANKLARIVWAVWTEQRPFCADGRRATAPASTPGIPSALQEDCIELT
jgi:transposase